MGLYYTIENKTVLFIYKLKISCLHLSYEYPRTEYIGQIYNIYKKMLVCEKYHRYGVNSQAKTGEGLAQAALPESNHQLRQQIHF